MSKSVPRDRWSLVLLACAGALLVAAFVLGPAALLRGSYPQFQDQSAMGPLLGRGLVEYWGSGVRTFPPGLAEMVDYWFAWHAIKIVISMLLTVVLGLLAATLWRRSLTAGLGHVIAATSATVLSLLSAFVAVINIQSTVAPVVALLPMLSDDDADGKTAQSLIESGVRSGDTRPPLLELLTQVEHYNWAVVVATAVVIAVVATGTVIAFRRYVKTDSEDRPHRRMFATLGSLGALMTIGMALLFIAAVVAVVDPGEALLGSVGL
ncbi:lysylphosphatidylglycerol synthetase-like protein (DUF2156 family) [Rhodococcus fascians]|uniref:hypothetical protein n=1 Tax=Nocardiaceae TaxID=85025 RepID=UPI00285F7F8E|nr:MULTISPECIES: hypothetical protein [Rhodococcus]MDR6909339.1 lysylphosphatidylglycerol synthetase-like protein (DUF2156 family) [Rhodococcus sp. 3258]MDR6929844.1 lysylphosphatidylglycerol synthetase-like protein (DUF2156 family) [Rhodococcus fascians]